MEEPQTIRTQSATLSKDQPMRIRSIQTKARRLASFVLAASLASVATTPTVAQSARQPEPWLGVPLPGGLALPPQLSVLRDGRFSADPSPVPPGEEGHAALEGEPIRALLRQIVDFSVESRANGELMWGRVSGFPAAAATADWVAAQYRAAGLRDVAVQRYAADAGMWWPDQWEVRLLGTDALGVGSDDVILRSAVPARGTEIPGGMLTAPLVFAGDVAAPNGVDVRGKVAIQWIRPSSGAFSLRSTVSEGADALFARGAVAVLNYIDQPGNMHVRDFGCRACFNIGGADGAFLREVAEGAASAGKASDLRVRLYLDAGVREGLTAQNVMGIVPGDSDEIVIVNAHLDGWYDATGDNGDGLAVDIALAHHFAKPENRPARTLVFVASGGHHSSGLNGPGHWVAMNPQLASRVVLVLNLEHIAQYLVDPATFEVQHTEQDMGWGISNMAPHIVDLTDRARERYGFRLRDDYGNGVPGDLGGYASLGVPRVQAIHAGPLYHTSGDVFETVSLEGLERAARFYAYFIDGVARASRAQLDP
jgi:hypothetical protein